MSDLTTQISNWVFLSFIIGIPLFATYKKLNVFDIFIDGAKQGFHVSMTIMPYLVAMMVAIGMLRASGFFELASHVLAPLLNMVGMPSELLPLALMRPFSGNASLAITSELIHQYGGESLIALTAATMMGSTETTFYVIAVYFGSVGIKRTRHAILAGLLADAAGIAASVYFCHLLFK